MASNHYVTKRNRRHKSTGRPRREQKRIAATMAELKRRDLEQQRAAFDQAFPHTLDEAFAESVDTNQELLAKLEG